MSGYDGAPDLRRAAVLTAVVVGACIAVAVAASHWDPPPVQDLRVYRDAAQRILDGQPLYPPGSRYGPDQPLPFTYPPFAALLFVPATLVPLGSAVAVWWLLSFLCLWWLARRSFAPLLDPLGPLGRWAGSLLAASGALLVLAPLVQLFAFGQVGLVLGVACLVDLDLAVRRSRAAGSLVGAATAVKLSPGGLVLTYVAARRWRPVALASATIAACWLVTALLLPGDTADWLTLVLDADRVGPVDAAVNTSWHGLVLRLLGSGAAAQAVWLGLGVATLAIGAVRSARALAHDDALRAATVMGFAIVLAAPISWSHHIVWVVPLVGLLVGSGRSWRGWLLAAGTILVFSEPGMRWTDYALGTPQLSGGLDWFWVNGCILVMAAAVLLLPVGRRMDRVRTSDQL